MSDSDNIKTKYVEIDGYADELEEDANTELDQPKEFFSRSWLHVEDLLKTHRIRRKNAAAILEATNALVKKDGSIDIKNDLIDCAISGVQVLTFDRVQSTPDPDARVINLVDSLGKQSAYGAESIRRRRKKAMADIAELDCLEECIDSLPPELQLVINSLYFTFEIAQTKYGELITPVRYAVAQVACGYKYSQKFEHRRKKAISILVGLMRKRQEKHAR